MIPGTAAAALQAKLAKARPRACRCFFHPLVQTALVRWLGSRHRCTPTLHFSVVCFRQFSMLPSEMSFDLGFSVVHTRQPRHVVCQLISHSRHCLFETSKLSSDLGDPRGVDWLIINRRQGGLNLFCATTCAVGYAEKVLEFDVFKVAREVLSACWSAFTAELLRPFRDIPDV